MLKRSKHSPAAGSTLLGGHLQRIAIAVMITTSFCLGLGVDRFTGDDADAESTLTQAPEFTILEETWDLIQNDYVALDQVEQEALFYGAASGMVDALGDTGHSSFLDPAEARAFERNSEGEFVGIGIQIDYSTGQPVVEYPLDGSPAEAAGIRARDVIVAVDGQETASLGLDQIREMLLGTEGEAVDLTILRPSTGETLEFHIVRARLEVDTVSLAMLPDDIALIRIVQFSAGATNELKASIRAAMRDGAVGIILDLRDNPGGYAHEAVGVASQFVPEGDALYLYQGQDEEPLPVNSTPGGLATEIPMVVLINGGSASAAEITAASLSDNGRATLIGEATFGTGTILTPFDLSDGSVVLLGTALWLEPDGDQIWKEGIDPDQVVTLPADADQLRAWSDPDVSVEELAESTDIQLQAAFVEMLEILQ